MSTSGEADRVTSFKSRLERVAERHAPREEDQTDISVLPDWQAPFRYPMTLVAAGIVGALGFFLAGIFSSRLYGQALAAYNIDLAFAADIGIAALIAAGLFAVYRIAMKKRAIGDVAQYAVMLLGVVVTSGVLHNIAHAAPGVSSVVFAADWTAKMQAVSKPGSLKVRDQYYVIFDDAAAVAEAEAEVLEEQAPLPRVIRLQ